MHSAEAAGLNYDILVLVMEFLPRDGESRLMRTCHALHRAGARFLLQFVYLSGSKAIQSFSTFMSVDHARFRYIHRLELDTPNTTEEDRAVLCTTLHQAKHLHSLSLRSSPGLLECDGGKLCMAIASLPKLRRLSLQVWVTFRTFQSLINDMSSDLDSIDVTRIQVPHGHSFLLDHTSLLSRFACSLRELRFNIGRLPQSTELRFTALEKLHLYGMQSFDMMTLVLIFPNLREFSMELGTEDPDVPRSIEWSMYVARCASYR